RRPLLSLESCWAPQNFVTQFLIFGLQTNDLSVSLYQFHKKFRKLHIVAVSHPIYRLDGLPRAAAAKLFHLRARRLWPIPPAALPGSAKRLDVGLGYRSDHHFCPLK